ncbi:retrovirus-related Pol polyprotein from transposon 412 [Nephila pilipes]|uniref:Retrovirus-related Pol polyprotein from transposon 412 n=1 Tax=Nephila pilipes TaxID=299642 RepID=A0A8X6QM86_NEPPI|nr:retrovirus-related Pol polyprotein from transposon 412 [Nephila pilipes]
MKEFNIEESLEKKIREIIEEALENANKEIEGLKEQISHEEPKGAIMPSLATIKLLTFDGKTPWPVYKTQFTMVAEANGSRPHICDKKIRSLEERKGSRNTKIQCWTCGATGHVRRICPTSRYGGYNFPQHQGKQKCAHPKGRRCPESQKSHFKVFHISSISGGDNLLFVMGHVNKVLCKMIIDTGANVTIIRTNLAHKLGENLIWTPPCITLQTVTG